MMVLCVQVLVPQVEKMCIDKGVTDETEILRFLQHGTLVGLLPVPHPILIRRYQANTGTDLWIRWGTVAFKLCLKRPCFFKCTPLPISCYYSLSICQN